MHPPAPQLPASPRPPLAASASLALDPAAEARTAGIRRWKQENPAESSRPPGFLLGDEFHNWFNAPPDPDPDVRIVKEDHSADA